MEENLRKAREIIGRKKRLAGFALRDEAGELHLEKAGDVFARLIPAGQEGGWRIELFRPTEGWEIVDFTGTLEECLEFLTEHPHYLFWER